MRTRVGIPVAGIVLLAAVVRAQNAPLPGPMQVQVQVQFIEVAKADADGLLRTESTGIPSKEKLLDLLRNRKAKVICAPSVTTPSGQEATVKAVQECIYPTSVTIEPSQTAQTNAAPLGAAQCVVVAPADFETREVGVILTCLPDVSNDGDTIHLALSPELIAEPIWKTYTAKCFTANGKERQFAFEQPFFHCRSLSTTLVLKDGATVIAGGGMPERNGEAVTFLLVTARVVDAGGNPQSRR